MAHIRVTLACLLMIGATGAGCGLDDAIFHEGEGILAGRVLTPEGAPVEGALVHFHRKTGIPEPAVTDEYGKFSVAGVPAGPQPLVIRHLDPERPLGARVTGRVVGGSTTVLRDTILGDAFDIRVAAADDTHRLWDAFIQIDEVNGLEGEYQNRNEIKYATIPNSGAYSFRVIRPPFIFSTKRMDISELQDVVFLTPEEGGTNYKYGRLYCGSFEVAEFQRQAEACSNDCSMPEFTAAIPSELPCNWPIGDDPPDDTWYLNSAISRGYLAKALGSIAETMACPDPDESPIACKQGKCTPDVSPEIEVELLEEGKILPEYGDPPPPAMTCSDVFRYLPEAVDEYQLDDCDNTLFIYYENTHLVEPPQLLATTFLAAREAESPFQVFYLAVLPLDNSRPQGETEGVSAGWCLHKLRFPENMRPAPASVRTRLSWLTTEENSFP